MNLRTIFIEEGNEYRIKTQIHENDLFKPQYREAILHLNRIVTSQISKVPNHKLKIDEQNNNIIVFDGERGQGKSSAMRSFVNILSDQGNSRQESIKILELPDSDRRMLNLYQFHVLDTIDPSNFEKHNSVLNTVVANMYATIKKKWEKQGSNNESLEKFRKIMKQFNDVYQSISFINDEKRVERLDYSNGIEQIAQVNQSDILAESLSKLVSLYLEILNTGASCYGRLVIPIDDLDTYIEKSYSLVDEIRKYLVLPNVIIVLACKIEQLRMGVELHYRKETDSLYRKEEFGYEIMLPRGMANKYIDKVLPTERRVALPTLTALDKADIDIFYGTQNDFQCRATPKNGERISNYIATLIFEKTNIKFVVKEREEHLIVPKTLRGVIDLVTLLQQMKNIRNEENELSWDIYENNLQRFKSYFFTHWINNSPDAKTIELGSDFANTPPEAINKRICYALLEVLQKSKENKDFTINTEVQHSIDLLSSFIFEKEKKESIRWALGDSITFINALVQIYENSSHKSIQFITSTLLTITMHELNIMSQQPVYNGIRSPLFDFYNNLLFGNDIVFLPTGSELSLQPRTRMMINQEVEETLISRTQFTINYSQTIDELSNSTVISSFLNQGKYELDAVGIDIDKDLLEKATKYMVNNRISDESFKEVQDSNNPLTSSTNTYISHQKIIALKEFLNQASVTKKKDKETAKQVEDFLNGINITLLIPLIYHNNNFSNDIISNNNTIVGLNSTTDTWASIECFLLNILDIKNIRSRIQPNNSYLHYLCELLYRDVMNVDTLSMLFTNVLVNYEVLTEYNDYMIRTRNQHRLSEKEYPGAINESRFYHDFFKRSGDFIGKYFEELYPQCYILEEHSAIKIYSEIFGICLKNRTRHIDIDEANTLLEKLEKEAGRWAGVKTIETWSKRLKELIGLLDEYKYVDLDWAEEEIQPLEEALSVLASNERKDSSSPQNVSPEYIKDLQEILKSLGRSITVQKDKVRKKYGY